MQRLSRRLLCICASLLAVAPAWAAGQDQPAGTGDAGGKQLHTVLITGANRGIGLEFARQYAERGCWTCSIICKGERTQDRRGPDHRQGQAGNPRTGFYPVQDQQGRAGCHPAGDCAALAAAGNQGGDASARKLYRSRPCVASQPAGLQERVIGRVLVQVA